MELGEAIHGAFDQPMQLGGPGKGNARQVGQLVEADDEGRRTGEPADDGLGNEVGEKAETEGAEEQLETPHHEGEEQGQLDVAVRAGHGHRAQAGGDEQGVHGHRPHSQLPGGSHGGIDDLGDEGGVQAVNYRQAGDHRVGHALWDEHDPDGQAGRKVLHPVAASVFGNPFEGGKPTSHEDKIKEPGWTECSSSPAEF
jgi:hypothetical protein